MRKLLSGFAGVRATVFLVFLLILLNAGAVVGILSARTGMLRTAVSDLELETTAQARSLDAALATLRGDFVFLTRASPLAGMPQALASDDAVTRRWGALDTEGAVLLFLETHPAVDRILVSDGSGALVVAAGRRYHAPSLLPLEVAAATPLAVGRNRFALGSQPGAYTLEAVLDAEVLLGLAVPGKRERFVLHRERLPAGVVREGGTVAVRVPVGDARWDPPVAWTLERRSDERQLLASVEDLARRYRATVLLNLGIIALALLVGVVALREVRRTARLEAESQHLSQVRELEHQLQHSERLASVGRLAAGMAHEINNPLEGMGNYLSLLEEDLAAGDNPGMRALGARVREGLERVAAVVRQVLSLANPGREPRVAVDLGELLERTADFVRTSPAFHHIAVEVAAGPAPLPVLGNPTTLGQLFLNLMLNACELQPGGGRLEVAAALRGERAVVTVADHGPGLSEEARERAFEPFFSTRGSTGLGLAVCHGIAVEHGGSIRGDNRPDGGAVFTVELPLAPALAAAPATEVLR